MKAESPSEYPSLSGRLQSPELFPRDYILQRGGTQLSRFSDDENDDPASVGAAIVSNWNGKSVVILVSRTYIVVANAGLSSSCTVAPSPGTPGALQLHYYHFYYSYYSYCCCWMLVQCQSAIDLFHFAEEIAYTLYVSLPRSPSSFLPR